MSAVTRIVRAVLLVFLGACVIGFGVCGICGTLGGAIGMATSPRGKPDYSGAMLVYGLVGLVIALVCWKIAARLRRKSPPAGR